MSTENQMTETLTIAIRGRAIRRDDAVEYLREVHAGSGRPPLPMITERDVLDCLDALTDDELDELASADDATQGESLVEHRAPTPRLRVGETQGNGAVNIYTDETPPSPVGCIIQCDTRIPAERVAREMVRMWNEAAAEPELAYRGPDGYVCSCGYRYNGIDASYRGGCGGKIEPTDRRRGE